MSAVMGRTCRSPRSTAKLEDGNIFGELPAGVQDKKKWWDEVAGVFSSHGREGMWCVCKGV